MSQATEHIILFSKFPQAGRVKTRLIPALGAEGAARLQRKLIAVLLGAMREAGARRSATLEVACDGGTSAEHEALFGADTTHLRQVTGDLGTRMGQAFAAAFARGASRVILLGSDCPTIDAATMCQALEALNAADVVLAPAHDQGYCLIGLQRQLPELFLDIPWSTESVLERTLQRAAELGVNVRLLPAHRDIDWPADLAAWEATQPRG